MKITDPLDLFHDPDFILIKNTLIFMIAHTNEDVVRIHVKKALQSLSGLTLHYALSQIEDAVHNLTLCIKVCDSISAQAVLQAIIVKLNGAL